jgi:hypothetical protein
VRNEDLLGAIRVGVEQVEDLHPGFRIDGVPHPVAAQHLDAARLKVIVNWEDVG